MHLSLFSLFATKLSAAGLIVFGGNPKLLNGQRAEITANVSLLFAVSCCFQLNRKWHAPKMLSIASRCEEYHTGADFVNIVMLP